MAFQFIPPLIAAATKIPRAAKIAKQVLRTSNPRPGGLVAAGKAMEAVNRSNAIGRGAGALMLGGSGLALSSDNEPRFEMRTPEGQIFTIDSMINNLMQEYDMVVRNQEFDRAQAVANEIDKLQQQKIAIQGMNARRQMVEDNFKLPPSPIPPERNMPPQQDEITRILDSISI